MKYSLVLMIFALFIYTGCSKKAPQHKMLHANYEKPTKEKVERFHQVMTKIALSTKSNPRYNRMALDTPEKKAWFKTLMYRLWDRQITRKAFISEGLKRYPKHHYEFRFIANGFQKY